MMLAKFRERYPQGSLIGELVKIDRSTYIVRVSLQVDNTVLATALAGADTVEAAEDAARQRAIAALMLDTVRSAVDENSSKVKSPATAVDTEVEQPSVKAIAQEPVTASNNEPKNVNFFEAETTVISEPTQTYTSETVPEKVETSAAWQHTQPTAVPQPAVPSSTLFGDTFTAEIPETPSIPEDNYIAATSEPEPELDLSSASELEAMDFNDIKQKTDIEIKRLGWTKDDGREFLKSRYGKRSRLHLTDEQLLEFLRYLEKLPNPVS